MSDTDICEIFPNDPSCGVEAPAREIVPASTDENGFCNADWMDCIAGQMEEEAREAQAQAQAEAEAEKLEGE